MRDRDKVIAERRARVLQMRAAGMTLQAIADELGHSSTQAVSMDIRRALEQATELAPPVEAMIGLELERMDIADRAANLVRAASSGAADPASRALVLAAIDRQVRITDRRVKLLSILARAQETAGRGRPASGREDSVDRIAQQRAKRRNRFRTAAG